MPLSMRKACIARTFSCAIRPEDLVEGSIPLAVPWRWIRAIDEIVLLRWFPATPIPMNS